MIWPFDRALILASTRRRFYRNKLAVTLELLKCDGVNPEIVSGIDFAISGLRTKLKYECDHPGSGYVMGAKTVAIFLGHLIAWQICKHDPANSQSFLIMEDDVRFRDGWVGKLLDGAKYLPPDWDIVYLGSCCCEGRPVGCVNQDLFSVSFAMCHHAYMISRKAIPVLLDSCRQVYAPVDIAVCKHALPKLKAFAFLPRLADQLNTELPA